MDRETMFNGWMQSKIVLEPTITRREDSVTVEVFYNKEQYRYTVYKEDMIGGADMYSIAHSRLLSHLKSIIKNIELKFIY